MADIAETIEMRSLSVSEIFGPTIQGEGPTQGRAVVFLRLGLCNLDCSWCDTPFTWDWTGKNGTVYEKDKELTRMTVAEIAERLDQAAGFHVRRVVISGGEPLIQQRGIANLIEHMAPMGWTFEIETNGTIVVDGERSINLVALHLEGLVDFNCSPKLANSGIERSRRIFKPALEALKMLDATFKFVVNSDEDIAEVEALQMNELWNLDPERLYLMPEGIERNDIQDRLVWVMEEAAKRGWGVSPRLHVLAHGNKRGV